MYCANCGAPRTQGLSYCNRCGADLRERIESTNTKAITAFLSAITLLGVMGLAVMLAGAMILRRGANLSQELIGVFMLFTFLIVSITEIMLVKNLSKLFGSTERKNSLPTPPPISAYRRACHSASRFRVSLKILPARSSMLGANTLLEAALYKKSFLILCHGFAA